MFGWLWVYLIYHAHRHVCFTFIGDDAYDNMPGMPKFIFNVNGVRARLQSLHSVARTPQHITKYYQQCELWGSLKKRKRHRIASKAFHIQCGSLCTVVCIWRSDNFTRADLRNAQNRTVYRSELSTEILAAACGYKWVTFNNVCLLRYAIDIIYGRNMVCLCKPSDPLLPARPPTGAHDVRIFACLSASMVK